MTLAQKHEEAKDALRGTTDKELDDWASGLDRLTDEPPANEPVQVIDGKEDENEIDRAFEGIEEKVPESTRHMLDMIRDAQVAENGHASGNFPVVSERVLRELNSFGLEPGSDPGTVAAALEMKKTLDMQLATRQVEEAADGGQELARQPFQHHWSGDKYEMHVSEITPSEYFLMAFDKKAPGEGQTDARSKRTEMVSRTFRLDDITNAEEKRVYLDNLMGQFHTEMALADGVEDLDRQIALGLGQGFEHYRNEGSLEDSQHMEGLEDADKDERTKAA